MITAATALTAWKAIKSFLASVPREVWYALAALAALWMAYEKGQDAGEAHERAAQAKAEAKQAEKARQADVEARRAHDATTGKVETDNQRARDVAADSDDPLRDGLRELGK